MKKLILAAFALTTATSMFAQGIVAAQVQFNNRIGTGNPNQTTHIWGPGSGAQSTLSLIGIGSNDNPSGTANFVANGMKLVGDGGTGAVATGDGKLVMGYRTTFSQLIAAVGQNQTEASLVPVGVPTTFRTGSSLGDVASVTTTIYSGLYGTSAWQDAPWGTFEIVAWDNSSGLYANWTAASDAWQHGLIAAGHTTAFNVAGISGTLNLPPVLTSSGQTVLQSFNLYYVPEPSMFALAGLGSAALLIFRRRK
jgi:hypothetical protein